MVEAATASGIVGRIAMRIDRCIDGLVFASPRFDYVYITNQKAACSTIKLALYRAELGDPDWVPARNIHTVDKRSIVPGPSDVGRERFEEMIGGGAFRFSFVRNPYARLLSAYRDKVEKQVVRKLARGQRIPPHQARRLKRRLGLKLEDTRGYTFEDFARRVCATPEADMDVHWRPQVINICHGLIDYDLVGRVENFEEDMERVSAATGLPFAPGARRNVTEAAGLLRASYTPELAAMVASAFAADFDAFGYSTALP